MTNLQPGVPTRVHALRSGVPTRVHALWAGVPTRVYALRLGVSSGVHAERNFIFFRRLKFFAALIPTLVVVPTVTVPDTWASSDNFRRFSECFSTPDHTTPVYLATHGPTSEHVSIHTPGLQWSFRGKGALGRCQGVKSVMQGREVSPLRLLLLLLVLALVGIGRCGGQRRSPTLALWIDRAQVEDLIGLPMKIPIITDGLVSPYLREPGISDQIQIPAEVDTVNLTWQAGEDEFTYAFTNFTTLDPNLLYPPLLGIPTHGSIPSGPTVFQITIPCKGKEEGVASLVLGLTIYTRARRPLKGTPIMFKLKKKCLAFVTTSLCASDCQNGGTCSEFGVCECRQGFQGKYCEIAMCNPVCQNNGTCISPEICACPSGYHGKLCEKAACGQPCENGGHCLEEGFCWCQKGFYGDACEFSACNPLCSNGGTCVGQDRCECPSNFSGRYCETKEERPKRSDVVKTDQHLNDQKRRAKRNRTRQKKMERKLLKAERRLLKIATRNVKAWNVTRDERRVLRRLEREPTRLFSPPDRKFLLQLFNRERARLRQKHQKKLRRYKKLVKKSSQMSPEEPTKQRVFV